jgi:hypothetical protein
MCVLLTFLLPILSFLTFFQIISFYVSLSPLMHLFFILFVICFLVPFIHLSLIMFLCFCNILQVLKVFIFLQCAQKETQHIDESNHFHTPEETQTEIQHSQHHFDRHITASVHYMIRRTHLCEEHRP